MKLMFSAAIAAILIAQASPATAFAALNESASCTKPAAVDGTPYFEMPSLAAARGDSGTTLVKIDLTPDGVIAGEKIFASSGNTVLDDAALRSARRTRFTPEIAGCVGIAGSYLYAVAF